MPADNIELIEFKDVLLSYGQTDQERAKQLGFPRRTFMEYKACRLPRHLQRLPPRLLRALANDIERANNQGVDE
jgi:hypothetical protein